MSMSSAESGGTTQRAGKYLTFFLRAEEYGIQILKVQEIIGLLPITVVPSTPSFVIGVVNLRGKIVPILDLRQKLGMPSFEPSAETCIVVVKARNVEVGVVVDRVREVVDIKSEDLEPAPDFGNDRDQGYLLGIGKAHGKVKLLLNIERVLESANLLQA